MSRAASAFVFLLFAAAGCSYPEFGFVPDDDPTIDSNVVGDGTIDSTRDTTADTASDDAGNDTSSDDSGADVTTDATLDSTGDSAVDSGVDSRTDTRDAAIDSGRDTLLDTADTKDTAADTSLTEILFPLGSTWKYLDNNVPPSTNWSGGGVFSDAAWLSGPAPLGFEYLDEGTVVSYGPDASMKYITTWFRKSFTVADATRYDQLTVRLQRDDGAVVYLNGVELARSNMPLGTIAPSTLASSTVGGTDFTVYSFTAPSTALKTGSNVIAVEVHQAMPGSSDLRMDLELDAHRP